MRRVVHAEFPSITRHITHGEVSVFKASPMPRVMVQIEVIAPDDSEVDQIDYCVRMAVRKLMDDVKKELDK